MTTDTTAPLSARLHERIVLLNSNGAEPLMQEAADALDALSARVKELEAALTAAQDEATANLMALTDEQVIAQAVADYGSAEAAVKAVTDMKARILQSMVNHYKDRAAKAEDESARRNELLMEALNELATTRGERDAAEARATQAVAERDAWRNRARNHADTLRGIRKMDPLTEGDRIKTWCDDGLSGYTATVEVTTKELTDRALKAEAALSASQAREAGMREALKTIQDEREAAMREIGVAAGKGVRAGAAAGVAQGLAKAASLIEAALSPAQPEQDRIAAASAFIDRQGPFPGVTRYDGAEVTGPVDNTESTQ